jgi:myosin-5
MIQSLELNGLCSLILERTINDPDKYQNGKTKIFFRAGMLAALEALRADRLNAMVTVVQKNMRRHMCMKRYREMRIAAIKIQTWWRGVMARRFVAQVRRETAAVRLQKAARRYVQRKRFTEVRTTVVRFQSRKCIVSIPLRGLRLLKSCLGIRGVLARRGYKERRQSHATTLLQSFFRGMYVAAHTPTRYSHDISVVLSEEVSVRTFVMSSICNLAFAGD